MLKDNLRMLASKHFSLPEIWGLQFPHTTKRRWDQVKNTQFLFMKKPLSLGLATLNRIRTQ